MGIADKARNKAEEVVGQAKEAVGKASDNDRLVTGCRAACRLQE